MNTEYNKFAKAMDYITPEYFYESYNKFSKYLPDDIDYNSYNIECNSLNGFFLSKCIYKLTNNNDICVYYYDDTTYEIEGCASIEEVDEIQELLDKLGLTWRESNKESEIAFINNNV